MKDTNDKTPNTESEEKWNIHYQLTEQLGFSKDWDGIVKATNAKNVALVFDDEPEIEKLLETASFISNLEALTIRKSAIKSLPEHLSKLLDLRIENTDIEQLPKNIGSRLVKLSANNNKLKELPKSFGAKSPIASLSANNNQIESIDLNFCKLPHLGFLYLNNNKISSLPEDFSNLESLQELELANNKLSELPMFFYKLTKLKKLNLSGNQLSELPAGLDAFTNLEELDLSNNNLTSVPHNLRALAGASLKMIDFRNNPIKYTKELQEDLIKMFEGIQLLLPKPIDSESEKTSVVGKVSGFFKGLLKK